MSNKKVLNMPAEVQTLSEVDLFLAEVKQRSQDFEVSFNLTKKPFGSESAEIIYYSTPDVKEEDDEISDEIKNNIREDVAGMLRRAGSLEQFKLEIARYFKIDSNYWRDRKLKELELLS